MLEEPEYFREHILNPHPRKAVEDQKRNRREDDNLQYPGIVSACLGINQPQHPGRGEQQEKTQRNAPQLLFPFAQQRQQELNHPLRFFAARMSVPAFTASLVSPALAEDSGEGFITSLRVKGMGEGHL